MYTNDIFTASCDDDFTMRAFADFLERKTDKYSELQAVITESLNLLENPDTDLDLEHVSKTDVRSFLQSKGWDPDVPVLTSIGYVQVDDLITSHLWNEVEAENCGPNAGELTSIQVRNAAGSLINYTNANDVLREIGENIINTQVFMQTTRAMAVKCEKGIEAAYTFLNEQLGRIGHTASKIQAAAKSFYGNVLDAAQSAKDYLNRISQLLALNNIAQDTDVPMNSQVYSMTGASPVCALDFTNLGKFVSTTFYGGAYLVAKLISSGLNWFEKLKAKVQTKLWMNTNDPYDIEVINYADNTNVVPSVKDLGYISSFDSYELVNVVTSFQNESDANSYAAGLNELYGGSSMYFRTIFGEVLFQELNFSVHHGLLYAVYWTGAIVLKPYMVTEDTLSNWVDAVFRTYVIHDPNNTNYVDVNHGLRVYNYGYVGTPTTKRCYQYQVGRPFYSQFTPEFAAQVRAEICEKIQAIKVAGNLYYDLPNEPETLEDLMKYQGYARTGLINGFFGLKLLLAVANAEFNGTDIIFPWYQYTGSETTGVVRFDLRIVFDRFPEFGFKESTPDMAITNQDLMEAACGYRVTGGETFFDTCPVAPTSSWVEHSGNTVIVTNSMIPTYISLMTLLKSIKSRQDVVAIEEYPFLPYRRNGESFGNARYKIVTDAENMAKFQSFWEKVVVAVAVIAVVVTTGVIAHKISRKIAMARQQRYYQYQQKLYNSLNDPSKPALTAREYRRMMRFEQRLNAVDVASTGSAPDVAKFFTSMTTEPETYASASFNASDIQSVISLIH